MDFGLHRFLEMFEERFGRRTTTLLLGVVGLAIFGVSANLIYADIALPLYHLIEQIIPLVRARSPFSISTDQILAASASGAAVIIVAGAWFLYWRHRLYAQLREAKDQISTLLDTYSERVSAIITSSKSGVISLSDIVHKGAERERFLIDKVRELLKLLQDLRDSGQLPSLPPEKKSPQKSPD